MIDRTLRLAVFAGACLGLLSSLPARASEPLELPFGPVEQEKGQSFSFALDLGSLPPRPVLRVAVVPAPLFLSDQVVCTGPGGAPAPSFEVRANRDIPLYQTYLSAAERAGVVCEIQLTPTNPLVDYTIGVAASSPPPQPGSTGRPEHGIEEAFTRELLLQCEQNTEPCRLESEDFFLEGDNFQFIGGGKAGTCEVTSSPEFGVDFRYRQEEQPGTGGWDCCTWRFDGIDGVTSKIGQVVFVNDGAPPAPDADADGILDPCDNCPGVANGPQAGSCTGSPGQACDADADCGPEGSCDLDQKDQDEDGKGDVCDPPDADEDGIPDATDNCPEVPNPGQEDRGGLGAGSPADGIGDACQCGDVNGSGSVTSTDATLLFNVALGTPGASLAKPELCDVNQSGACNAADATLVFAHVRGVPVPSFQPRCSTPATP